MIWKAKYTEPELPVGTTRERRVFAWLPTKVGSDIVWLAYYAILQIYYVTEYPAIVGDKQGVVKVASWIETSKRVLK